jgi:hypothetical protein
MARAWAAAKQCSLQIAQVCPLCTAHSALLFDEVEDVFPPISSEAAQIMARADVAAFAQRQRQRQKPGQPDPGKPTPCPRFGDQPHRTGSTWRFAGVSSPPRTAPT